MFAHWIFFTYLSGKLKQTKLENYKQSADLKILGNFCVGCKLIQTERDQEHNLQCGYTVEKQEDPS